jgi:hypothetical protein
VNRRIPPIARETLVAATYLCLAAAATYPLLGRFAQAVPLGGDSWVNYWNLWWVKHSLFDTHTNPFFSPLLYYPYGASLYFHTLNLLPAAVIAPVTATLGPIVAFNCLVVLSFVLSGYFCYRLALYVLRTPETANHPAPHFANRAAAIVAGALFAVCSYRYVHLLGHLDLLQTELLPAYILLLLKVFDGSRRRDVVLASLLLAATLLTAAYYVVFLLIATLLMMAATFIARSGRWTPALTRACLVLALFMVFASPVLAPMLVRGLSEGQSPNPAFDAERFSTDLLGFVVPSPLAPQWAWMTRPLYRRLMRSESNVEIVGFLGFVLLALSVVGMRSAGRVTRPWIAAAIVFGILALGPVVHVWGIALGRGITQIMPYTLLTKLPYGRIPRVPGRFVVMATLALTIPAAFGARHALGRISRYRGIAAAALIAAGLLENAVLPLPLAYPTLPAYFAALATSSDIGAILELPIADDPQQYPVRMLFQTVHQRPIFGGALSRGLPPLPFDAIPGFSQLKHLSPTVDDIVAYDESALPDLSRIALATYGARHVVIEKWLMDESRVDAARRTAEALFGPAAEYEDHDTLVFTVPPPPPLSKVAAWLGTGWSYLERDPSARPGQRWHWMGSQADVVIVSPQQSAVTLRLIAQAYGRTRRISFRLDGEEIDVLPIEVERRPYRTRPFDVPAGKHTLQLLSLDGADSPARDPRKLSVALFGLDIS